MSTLLEEEEWMAREGKGLWKCDIATWVVCLLGFFFFIWGRLKELQVFSLERKRLEGNINQVYNIFKQVDKEERKKYPEMLL